MSDAIERALAAQRRAAEAGFDWPEAAGVWDKLEEELAELRAAAQESPQREQEEWGDVMFTLLNLARHLGVDPAAALRAATERFCARYAVVEAALDELPPRGDPRRLEAMERCWQSAKRDKPGHGPRRLR